MEEMRAQRNGFDFFEVEFGNKPSVAQALGRLGAD